MNPLKMVLGFVPLVLFGLLQAVVPVGWAAAVGFVAASALVAMTARGGLTLLPVAQAAILLAVAVAGLLGGPGVDDVLSLYARGGASIVLGLVILATASRAPFTAQFARQAVPQEVWHSASFLEVNRRISLAWGLAVVVVGVCHVVSAGLDGSTPLLGVLLERGVPVLAFVRVVSYTRGVARNALA